ncbi:MAG TPA: DNA-3-methyladenine glycosylase [Vicinamibacteria bacterium]|nr:DNA-3-methyladenine glycosylase [Vicinamibacteria bacterium]
MRLRRPRQAWVSTVAVINSNGLGWPSAAERRRLLDRLGQPPEVAARLLLGTVLVRRLPGGLRAARIVEAEAYLGEGDPAAHAFRGRTARTEPLWGPPGTLYVYFIYGMHHCLNFAVEREGRAGCVLIRAAEPVASLDHGSATGPGRLCRALDIDTTLSGRHLFEAASTLYLREGPKPARVGVSARVGIRRAAERPLRFFDAGSAAVSPRRARAAYPLRSPGGRLPP